MYRHIEVNHGLEGLEPKRHYLQAAAVLNDINNARNRQEDCSAHCESILHPERVRSHQLDFVDGLIGVDVDGHVDVDFDGLIDGLSIVDSESNTSEGLADKESEQEQKPDEDPVAVVLDGNKGVDDWVPDQLSLERRDRHELADDPDLVGVSPALVSQLAVHLAIALDDLASLPDHWRQVKTIGGAWGEIWW